MYDIYISKIYFKTNESTLLIFKLMRADALL